jgi:hypothetical protein
MRARITKRLVDGLKPAGTDYYVFDTDTIGFAVRVRTTGGMRWGARWVGRAKGSATRPSLRRYGGKGGRRRQRLPIAFAGPLVAWWCRRDMARGGALAAHGPARAAWGRFFRRCSASCCYVWPSPQGSSVARWGRGASVVPWDETFCVSHVPAYGPKNEFRSLN